MGAGASIKTTEQKQEEQSGLLEGPYVSSGSAGNLSNTDEMLVKARGFQSDYSD